MAAFVVLAIGVAAQEPPATLPDGTTLAIRLEQPVKLPEVRAGDAVRASLLAPVLLHGTIAIPKNAEIFGRVLEAEPLGPARVSRLVVRFEEARWRGGSIALRAYIVRHLAMKATVVSADSRGSCPPMFQFLGNQQSSSGTGTTPQQPAPPQNNSPLALPPPVPPPSRSPTAFERCNPRRARPDLEKITFTSPPLRALEIRHLGAPAGATELVSRTKNVELPRGTMLELRVSLP